MFMLMADVLLFIKDRHGALAQLTAGSPIQRSSSTNLVGGLLNEGQQSGN